MAQAPALPARQSDRPAPTLPPRGEFVVRGAHVLSMDPGIGDLASGDVHVRDGTIVAVSPSVAAAGAEVIDGGGMICGKRADLILVRTTDINMSPVGDPYDALVSLAHPGNVDTVVADGRILRRKGAFTALDFDQVVRESALTAAALRQRAEWP